MEELLNKCIPAAMLFLFILTVRWARKVNPGGGKKTVYIATKDLFRKEKCPYCGCKMKKTWKEDPIDIMGIESVKIKEFKGTPIFTCKKCGCKK